MLNMPPVIDDSKYPAIGIALAKRRDTAILDRKAAEDQWLRNLRQFRGIYDPEILKLIPENASKSYPKLTRWKVIGTVARLMQMLFPQTDRNYNVEPSPMPELTVEDTQAVLDKLVKEKAEAGQIQPKAVVLTDQEIEAAIMVIAKEKASQMQKKVDDDLVEMDYVRMVKRVVFSAVLYNIGILKGPMHKKAKARTWEKDQNTGLYKASEIEKLKPYFEVLPVWAYYPDMTAVSLDKQEGEFERHVTTRAGIEELGDLPGYLKDKVEDWLTANPVGNYKSLDWEDQLKAEPKSDRKNTGDDATRKYVYFDFNGNMTGGDLKACGVEIAEDKVQDSFRASVTMLDDKVIRCAMWPLNQQIPQYHIFLFEEDDLRLLGNGLPDVLRDSQMSLCESSRSAHDNMSVIGTQLEVNKSRLAKGIDATLSKHKVWLTDDDGPQSQNPAVRNIPIDSHLPELINMMNVAEDTADKESGLPRQSLGDVSGGGSEALRTQKNASMFLGAAALPIRDTVRNFDVFTKSVMEAAVSWNQKFDPRESRDGDHNVVARGSSSLIAKEVLAESLDQLRATITEDELPYVNARKLFQQRMKARDIPIEEVMEEEAVAEQKIAAQQQAAAEAAAGQKELVEAQVKEVLSKAFKNVQSAEAEGKSVETDRFAAIIEALEVANGNDTGAKKSASGNSKAKA